jgi:hypothetical protein
MPLLIDEDAKTVGTFDITTAQTLYWKAVPVLLKQPEREEQVEQLTFRILSGYTRPNQSLRVSIGAKSHVMTLYSPMLRAEHDMLLCAGAADTHLQ